LQQHRRGFRNTGIALLVLGAVAIALPLAAVLAFELLPDWLLLAGLPGSATWIPGIMVGINLLSSGLTLISLASQAKD
jgi:uncharacterized membrane protein HdeD (DUF308 family)